MSTSELTVQDLGITLVSKAKGSSASGVIMKAHYNFGVLLLASAMLTGCNVYIDVPVAVNPATEPAATPVVEPTAIVTTLPTIVVTLDPIVVPTAIPSIPPLADPIVIDPITMAVNLQWTPPSQREDGTLLTESELKQYEIRYRPVGTETFTVTHVDASETSLPLPNLPIADYEFQIAAIDNDGLYSDFVSATQ